MDELNHIADSIYAALVAKNSARDSAIARSREIIRHVSEGIRAIHRREWEAAEAKLESARAACEEMLDSVAAYPDLYFSGYSQDAFKELVEGFATYAMVRNRPLPTPDTLNVENDTYLNGLAEAATELRRFILDILRREDGDTAEAERLLDAMDAIYDKLVTFDFPDAITGGLRRQTDIVRGVLERTRGDLTTTLRQQRLQTALEALNALTPGPSPSGRGENDKG